MDVWQQGMLSSLFISSHRLLIIYLFIFIGFEGKTFTEFNERRGPLLSHMTCHVHKASGSKRTQPSIGVLRRSPLFLSKGETQ